MKERAMRYRNHTLEAFYLPGSDFTVTSAGRVLPRRPTRADIDFVQVTPDDGATRFNCSSFKQAKACIDHISDLHETHRPNP